ncbi:MAG: hypothetical protein NTW29_18615 [Bacteroidetes bacterium]|nr:hypothetical protein [Bacteroidota bacterium]
MKCKTLLTGFVTLLCLSLSAQQISEKADSSLAQLSKLSTKYVQAISSKTDKYYKALTAKTEKTLERLAKWEAKIKTILEKASPETAQRLFANPELTFAGMLQKYREGKLVVNNYAAQYNEYRDKLSTTLKYLDNKKDQLNSSVTKPLQAAKAKADTLEAKLKETEAIKQFIKERKKQLLDFGMQYLGKSKYMEKISKENWYYLETLKNYKQIFSDPRKTEELAMKLLEKVPGFTGFLQRNSMLASLFRTPDAGGGSASLAGLQTRSQVNNLIQNQLAAGGPNAQEQFRQNLSAAQSQLSELKNKILKAGGGSSNDEQAEGFKKNEQRGKPLKKKIEFSVNAQTNRGSAVFPVSSDLGLSAGFRPHQNFVAGVGLAGRIGWGRDIRHISLSYSGISARSFAEYKLRRSFHVAFGFEMNYRPEIRNLDLLKDYAAWQRSGLVGVSKVVSVKSKFFKKASAKLMWDFLSYHQVPVTQPIIFRLAYSIK